MAGFLSGLEGLLKALGVNTPPPSSLANQVKSPALAAPATQTNPAGPPPPAPATPAAPSSPAPEGFGAKAEHFLENPLLQGALGAYLGTISSPRRQGWGMALARGGLTGLEGFNRAEAQKSREPLEQAQLAEAQARIPQAQAQTQLAQARTRALTPDPQVSAKAAEAFSMMAQDPGTSPVKKAIIASLLPGIQSGHTPVDKAWKTINDEDIASARVLAIAAATKKSEAETSLVPLKGKELESATSKNLAETSLIPQKSEEIASVTSKNAADTRKLEAETSLVGKPKPSAAGGVKPPSPLAIEKQARSQAEKDWAAESGFKTRGGMFGGETHDDFVSRRTEEYKQKLTADTGGNSGPIRGTHNGVPGTFDPSTNTFTPDA